MHRVRIHQLADVVDREKLNLRGLLAKLSVFFLPDLSKALVVDADSVLAGTVLDHFDQQCALNSLNSMVLDLGDPSHREMFNRWAFEIDVIEARQGRPVPSTCPFVQGSHFFVNVDEFPKDLIYRSLRDMSYEHGPVSALRAGDQGFWNFVAVFGGDVGLLVRQTPMTIQVGQTPHEPAYDRVDFLESTESRSFYFIHFVGTSRRYLRRQHEYATALRWATRKYYERIGRREFVSDELRRGFQTFRRAIKHGVNTALHVTGPRLRT
jgi:hypothetical protein